MTIINVIAGVLTAIVVVAAIDVALRPGAQTAQVLTSFGSAFSGLISAAKS